MPHAFGLFCVCFVGSFSKGTKDIESPELYDIPSDSPQAIRRFE